MHWVIQENIFNEYGYGQLIDVLHRFSIPHSIVKVVPFDNRTEPDVSPEGNVIVMGAYTMWRVAKAKQWIPGSFINDNFDYKVQQEHWGDLMFNSDSIVCCFDSVPEHTEPFFIRPIHDTKSFTGCVMTPSEFTEWRQPILEIGETSYCTIQKDTLVQVATYKEIYAEYRLWIVDKKIVTASLYKRGGQVYSDEQVDDDILEFGYKCISTWVPARAFCLDIFVGPNGPRIGEVNNINAAGFYKANIQKLILALNEMDFGDSTVHES